MSKQWADTRLDGTLSGGCFRAMHGSSTRMTMAMTIGSTQKLVMILQSAWIVYIVVAVQPNIQNRNIKQKIYSTWTDFSSNMNKSFCNSCEKNLGESSWTNPMLHEKSAAADFSPPVVIYRGPFGSAVVCILDCELPSMCITMFLYDCKLSRLLYPFSSPIFRRFRICQHS